MLNIRNIAICGALIVAFSGAAKASILEPSAENVKPDINLHAGAFVSPRGGALAGIDLAIPTLSLGNGWHGRVDADVLFKANFAGVDTVVPVTIDQLYYLNPNASGKALYYGAGVGAVFSGKARIDGKLIVGTTLTSKLGAEANIHFTDKDTLVTLLARIRL